jgi:hypothetical protein
MLGVMLTIHAHDSIMRNRIGHRCCLPRGTIRFNRDAMHSGRALWRHHCRQLVWDAGWLWHIAVGRCRSTDEHGWPHSGRAARANALMRGRGEPSICRKREQQEHDKDSHRREALRPQRRRTHKRSTCLSVCSVSAECGGGTFGGEQRPARVLSVSLPGSPSVNHRQFGQRPRQRLGQSLDCRP